MESILELVSKYSGFALFLILIQATIFYVLKNPNIWVV